MKQEKEDLKQWLCSEHRWVSPGLQEAKDSARAALEEAQPVTGHIGEQGDPEPGKASIISERPAEEGS